MDFDTIVLGTDLSESILAAALSKAGFKVGHFDANPYYGGDDASLTVDDLRDWAESRKKNPNTVYLEAQRQRFSSISLTSSNVPRSRTFSISLSPTIIPSVGPLVDSLVASGVSRYSGFKLLESIAVFDQPSKVKPVPTSKEDVFKNKELSLVDKRRLMRFLLFAAGEFEGSNELAGQETQTFLTFLREKFSLANKVADAIAYALAFCTSPSDLTLPALQRIRRYLRSAGRYGPSPFLVGHYGGIGEIAQGFCRAAAVNGATYVLGRNIMSLNPPPKSLGSQANLRWSLSLDDLDEHPSSRIVAAQPAYIPSSSPSSPGGRSARCVAIINTPIRFSEPPPELNDDVSVEDIGPGEIDTGLLIFPPSSVDSGSSTAAASCLITGEGSMATPSGHWILSFSIPMSEQDASREPEELLKPYLEAALTLTSSPSPDSPTKPLLTCYYLQTLPSANMVVLSGSPQPLFTVPSDIVVMSETADTAATHAEEAFWKIVKDLERKGVKPTKIKSEGEGERSEEGVGEEPQLITQFWPPLDSVGDDDD